MSYRYTNIEKINTNTQGNEYYTNVIYPDIPITSNDQYIITTVGDRLDLIAYDTYKDVNLWWIIAAANNLTGDSMYPPVGTQLRLPANIQIVVNKFNAINSVR